MENLFERDKTATKPIIVLIYEDRALEKSVDKSIEQIGLQQRVDA
jgi:hypothetical protein